MLKINDANNFRRTALGLCLIAGPLVTIVGGLVSPWEGTETSAGYLQSLSENPARWQVSAVLFYFGFLLTAVGVFGMIHLVKHRAVVLANIAGVLAVWGWVTLPGLLVSNFQDLSLAESLDIQQAVAVSERALEYVGATIQSMPVLLGFLGMALLGVALWREKVAPVWVPVVLVIGIAADLVPSSVVPPGINFTVSSGLLFAGLGYVGLKILRMSDEEWEHGVPPTSEPVVAKVQPQVR
ncbi:MAG: DUF4386 family protein [Rubrobacteraceae bacterium]